MGQNLSSNGYFACFRARRAGLGMLTVGSVSSISVRPGYGNDNKTGAHVTKGCEPKGFTSPYGTEQDKSKIWRVHLCFELKERRRCIVGNGLDRSSNETPVLVGQGLCSCPTDRSPSSHNKHKTDEKWCKARRQDRPKGSLSGISDRIGCTAANIALHYLSAVWTFNLIIAVFSCFTWSAMYRYAFIGLSVAACASVNASSDTSTNVM